MSEKIHLLVSTGVKSGMGYPVSTNGYDGEVSKKIFRYHFILVKKKSRGTV